MQYEIRFETKTKCIKCGEDGSNTAFEDVFEINENGECNLCENSHKKYLKKKLTIKIKNPADDCRDLF